MVVEEEDTLQWNNLGTLHAGDAAAAGDTPDIPSAEAAEVGRPRTEAAVAPMDTPAEGKEMNNLFNQHSSFQNKILEFRIESDSSRIYRFESGKWKIEKENKKKKLKS